MNREERRKAGVKGKAAKGYKEPTYVMTKTAMEDLRLKWTEDGVKKAFVLLLALPMVVIHDKMSEIWKKDGREERFVNLVLEQYDCYNHGYVSIAELQELLKQEAGLDMSQIMKRFYREA